MTSLEICMTICSDEKFKIIFASDNNFLLQKVDMPNSFMHMRIDYNYALKNFMHYIVEDNMIFLIQSEDISCRDISRLSSFLLNLNDKILRNYELYSKNMIYLKLAKNNPNRIFVESNLRNSLYIKGEIEYDFIDCEDGISIIDKNDYLVSSIKNMLDIIVEERKMI